MKKTVILFLFCLLIGRNIYSQTANNVTVTVEITNVTVNGGIVYLVFFSNAESFRNEQPEFAFGLQANNTRLSQEVSLPAGEYVVTAFQDANGNQRLDSNFLGIPRELIGISNYNGRGLPTRNFDRQKIMINNTTRTITINLYRF